MGTRRLGDKLWAPWREAYVTQPKLKGCLFCTALRRKKDKRSFIFTRSASSLAMLNIFPYNAGHVMVAPKRHVRDLAQLSEFEIVDLARLVVKTQRALQSVLHPHGFNIGMNCGRVAGAGIVGHLHVHIVPRWTGDTNFMPVIGETKVLSQSLSTLYKRLKKCS